MRKKFSNNMIIHCPERQQAVWLVGETDVPERNSKEEAISGWDKYREKTVYGLMWIPESEDYENPTLIWYGSIDDETVVGKKIVKYEDIEDIQ